MKRPALIAIWATALTAVCVALSAFSLLLSRPVLPDAPNINRGQYYKIFSIRGACQINLDYPEKKLPDNAVLSSSFDKIIEAYERDFFNKVVDLYLNELPVHGRLRISVFGFSKADRKEIEELFKRLIRDEYPPNLAWQVWALCHQ